jgi:hypothetical protein
MKTIRIHNPGPSEAMQREDVPDSLSRSGTGLIKVRKSDPTPLTCPDYISRHVQPCYSLSGGAGKHRL